MKVYLFRHGKPVIEGFPCDTLQAAAEVAFDIGGRGGKINVYMVRRCIQQGYSWHGIRFCGTSELTPEGTTTAMVSKISVEVRDVRDGGHFLVSPFPSQRAAYQALGISQPAYLSALAAGKLIQGRWKVVENRSESGIVEELYIWRKDSAGSWTRVVKCSSIESEATCIGASVGQVAYIVDANRLVKGMAVTTVDEPPQQTSPLDLNFDVDLDFIRLGGAEGADAGGAQRRKGGLEAFEYTYGRTNRNTATRHTTRTKLQLKQSEKDLRAGYKLSWILGNPYRPISKSLRRYPCTLIQSLVWMLTADTVHTSSRFSQFRLHLHWRVLLLLNQSGKCLDLGTELAGNGHGSDLFRSSSGEASLRDPATDDPGFLYWQSVAIRRTAVF